MKFITFFGSTYQLLRWNKAVIRLVLFYQRICFIVRKGLQRVSGLDGIHVPQGEPLEQHCDSEQQHACPQVSRTRVSEGLPLVGCPE